LGERNTDSTRLTYNFEFFVDFMGIGNLPLRESRVPLI
jgi:hypothetical protein